MTHNPRKALKTLRLVALFAWRAFAAHRKSERMLREIGDQCGALDMSDYHFAGMESGFFAARQALVRAMRLLVPIR